MIAPEEVVQALGRAHHWHEGFANQRDRALRPQFSHRPFRSLTDTPEPALSFFL